MAETTTRIYELQVKLASESLAQLKKISSSAAEIDKAFASATSAVKSFGAGLLGSISVGGLVAFVKGSIDATAALGDMAAATGASVENLSKLQQVAQVSGVDMETVAGALGNLNKALHDSEKGSRTTELALKAIGLSIKELRDLDPAEAFRRIAVNLDKFADGGGKSAAMTVLLGDASRKTASYVKDLAGAGEQNAKITKEQTEKADEFNKQLRKMSADAAEAGRALVQDLIPSLSSLIEWFNEGVRVAGSFWELVVLRATNPVQALTGNVDSLTKKLAELRAERDKAATGAGGRLALADVDRLDKQIIATEKLLRIEAFRQKQIDDAAAKAAFVGPPRPPGLNPPVVFDPAAAARARAAAEKAAAEAAAAAKKLEEEARRDLLKSIDAQTEAYEDELRALNAAVNGGKSYTEVLEAEKKVIDELTGAAGTQKLIDQIALLDRAYEDGRITLTEYMTALERMGTTMKQVEKPMTDLDKMLEAIADKVDGYSKSIADSLVDFATGADDAKKSFSDFATSVLRDLARMTTQMLLIEPLMAGFKTWIKGVSVTSNAQGGVYSSPSLSQYSGGVYDKPRLFSYAKGGVFAEAGPEAIMPLSRGSDGSLGVDASGAGVTVNVFNESKAEVTTATRTDINGARIIELMVKDAVSAGFRSGAFDGVMGATYGLNRQGAR